MFYATIIAVFLASHLLRGLVIEHVVVVDPASNHVGWYGWSLLVTALRWQWWTALLLQLRPSRAWCRWIFLALLLVVDAFTTFDSRYSKLIYGSALSASGHQIMTVLHVGLSIGQSAALLLLAFVAARRPLLLPMLAIISALKIFTSDLPLPANPFPREVISSCLPTTVYLTLAASIFIYLRGRSDREGLLGAFKLWRSRPAPRSSTPTTTS